MVKMREKRGETRGVATSGWQCNGAVHGNVRYARVRVLTYVRGLGLREDKERIREWQ